MAIDYKHYGKPFGEAIVKQPNKRKVASLNGVWPAHYNDDTDCEYAMNRHCTECTLPECAYYEREELG
jgi:hypothetical protein